MILIQKLLHLSIVFIYTILYFYTTYSVFTVVIMLKDIICTNYLYKLSILEFFILLKLTYYC